MEPDGKVVWAARYDALGKLESIPVHLSARTRWD